MYPNSEDYFVDLRECKLRGTPGKYTYQLTYLKIIHAVNFPV